MLTRRQLIRRVVYSFPPVVATAKLAAAHAGGLEFVVNEIEVPVRDLPERLKGVNFIQLSDLHLGIQFNTLVAAELRKVVEVVNGLKPDFIVLTGDIMDRMPFELREETEILARLKGKHGLYGILGNHEHYAGAPTIYHGLVRAGVDMLVNEHRVLKIHDEELLLLGTDTPKSVIGGTEFLRKAVRKTLDGVEKKDLPKILMSHHPNGWYHASPRGVDLTISGHTHGGQLVFGDSGGFQFNPGRVVYKYVKGYYKREHTHLYVNNGLGHWLPLRVNCPPEVTRYTLV
ncbi:MAG: metallophosphoesterase [Candidatus Methylomirabilis sp.]|nr:metallophosphoesterase [Deltaproteobacteria bacterium]